MQTRLPDGGTPPTNHYPLAQRAHYCSGRGCAVATAIFGLMTPEKMKDKRLPIWWRWISQTQDREHHRIICGLMEGLLYAKIRWHPHKPLGLCSQGLGQLFITGKELKPQRSG
jgi:hypothetical protein